MTVNWRPSCSIDQMKLRAEILQKIRDFMQGRNILEVDTAVLSMFTVTDPHIESMTTEFNSPEQPCPIKMYLHTSPEYAMKRMLSSGCGAIYQIAKVFRNNESGNLHNPEFTLLEWYQPGYSVNDMLDEIESLLSILDFPSCIRVAYTEIFETCTGINPHLASHKELLNKALDAGLHSSCEDISTLLEFLFNRHVIPRLKTSPPTIVYDYPVSQSALAKIRQDEIPVAERFELFISGIEIANGFLELCDAKEQRNRFENDIARRRENNQIQYDIDERMLSALSNGMPECTGVAIGLDRLIMVRTGVKSIQDVMAFPVQIA